MRGEKADGCQSLPPGAAGQISRTTLPTPVFLASTSRIRPVWRSTPVETVIGTNGSADSTWPVARSITYTKPLRSGRTSTLR